MTFRLDRAGRAMSAFALHASTLGALFARLPEIQKALGLSEATFGLVLLGMPAGVVLGSIIVTPAIEAFGPKRVLTIGLPLLGVLCMLNALATSAAVLTVTIFLFGIVFATGNVAINVEADRVEAAEDRRILNRSHGWWAVGFLVTSLLSAGLIRIGVTPFVEFLALAALLALLVWLLLGPLPVSTPRANEGARRRRFAIPSRSTMLIGGFALAGIVLEGTTRSWAVIYVRDVFEAADWIAALALPAVVVAQTLGRFLGDGWVKRWGPVSVGRTTAAVMFAGTIVLAAAPGTAVALAGLALVGLGISIVVPQAFSAAARWGDRPAAEAMAAFALLSTMLSFLGPPIVGLVAEWAGLRATFAMMIPLPLVAMAFAGYLAPRGPEALATATK